MTDEMSNVDTLVKRLREASCLSFDDWTTVEPYSDYRTAPEAADRIEALTAQLQDMQGHIDHADAYHNAMLAAEAERDEYKRNAAYSEHVVRAARAEIDRLREALKPFADEAEHWEFYVADELLVEGFPTYDGIISVGDLRNARAALKGQQR